MHREHAVLIWQAREQQMNAELDFKVDGIPGEAGVYQVPCIAVNYDTLEEIFSYELAVKEFNAS